MATRFTVREFTKSIIYDGSNDFVTLPIVPSVTSFSCAFWLKTPPLDVNDRIVDWQDAGPVNGFTFVQSSSGFQFVIRNDVTTVAAITASPLLRNGNWYFIVGTYEVNSVKLYINAIQNGSTDTSVTMTAAATTLTIGRRAPSSSNYMNGLIDNFMFWNDKVLTQTEIDNLYYSDIVPSGLTTHLNFDDGVTDSSGSANNGTANGSPAYSTDVRFKARTAL